MGQREKDSRINCGRTDTSSQLDDASYDDDEEGEELSEGEVVLHLGGRLHAPAVDEGKEADTAGSQYSHTEGGGGGELGEGRIEQNRKKDSRYYREKAPIDDCTSRRVGHTLGRGA